MQVPEGATIDGQSLDYERLPSPAWLVDTNPAGGGPAARRGQLVVDPALCSKEVTCCKLHTLKCTLLSGKITFWQHFHYRKISLEKFNCRSSTSDRRAALPGWG